MQERIFPLVPQSECSLRVGLEGVRVRIRIISAEALERFGKPSYGICIILNGQLVDIHESVVCLGYREDSRLDETRWCRFPEGCKTFGIWAQEKEARATVGSVVVVGETTFVRKLCGLKGGRKEEETEETVDQHGGGSEKRRGEQPAACRVDNAACDVTDQSCLLPEFNLDEIASSFD